MAYIDTIRIDGVTYQIKGDSEGGMSVKRWENTLLSEDWVGESAPYTQTITINDMLATYKVDVDLLMSDEVDVAIEQQTEFGKVSRVDSQDGSLLFTCYEEKPEIDLTIRAEALIEE